jgi:hypothetical protein
MLRLGGIVLSTSIRVEKTKLELGVLALFCLGLSFKYSGSWFELVIYIMSLVFMGAFVLVGE